VTTGSSRRQPESQSRPGDSALAMKVRVSETLPVPFETQERIETPRNQGRKKTIIHKSVQIRVNLWINI
jgi:hypothetical protein